MPVFGDSLNWSTQHIAANTLLYCYSNNSSYRSCNQYARSQLRLDIYHRYGNCDRSGPSESQRSRG